MSPRSLRNLKFAFIALFALVFFAAPATTASAKPKKAKYATIKILTNPAGLLLMIDGKPHGETTTDYRAVDLDAGLHTVQVRLPNGQFWTREVELPAGRVKCVVVNYRPLPPLPKSPCPFPVNISGPSQVTEGEIITYTADVSYSGNAALKYTWKVTPSSAHVISGLGTATLNVDSTGLGGQRITATLTADDGSSDPACAQSAQAVSMIAPIKKVVIVAREFDECNNCTFDDQKARLDNLAVELQNDPTTRAYIIAYGGRMSPVGQVEKLMNRAREYMVTQRGIDASRLSVVNGGYREEDSVELWIVPSGAAVPQATPTVQAGEVKRRKR
ncbi:MAG TPA: PEGA domain-containing protein [Pyrinomonadaceae bacterium]|nr:PEGA domain-containing protein [Pyrinomonadaceae bacterium]